MSKKLIFPIFSIIIIVLAYIKYNEIQFLGNDSSLNEVNIKNKNNFEFIDSKFPINHLAKINEEFLIGSSFDINKIFLKGDHLENPLENGNLVLFNIKTKELTLTEIKNFPQNVPFHPHSLDLYKLSGDKYYLYIVNHSCRFQGISEERVEKVLIEFENKKIWQSPLVTLTYKTSFTIPKNYFGTIKDIAIINLDTFYFTTNLIFPLQTSSQEDQKLSIIFKLYKILSKIFILLNIKKTYLYSYHDKKINKIEKSEGLSNSGLTYDREKSLLYMARSMEKDIKIFEVLKNYPPNALLINSIKTLYNVNHLYYDEEYEKLYTSIYGSQRELIEMKNGYLNNNNFDSVNTFGGFEELNQKNDYQISDIILLKNQLKGITSSVKIQNDIFLSSSFQNGLLIYHRKKYN